LDWQTGKRPHWSEALPFYAMWLGFAAKSFSWGVGCRVLPIFRGSIT
jgi:hypothetical protein